MILAWRLLVIASLIWFGYKLWTDDLSLIGYTFITILLVKEIVEEVGEMVDIRTNYWIDRRDNQ